MQIFTKNVDFVKILRIIGENEQKESKMTRQEGTRINFIGGNNEYRIGANSILVEHTENNKPAIRILIDDGSMFPPDWIDYDAAIPDMSRYMENPYSPADKPVDAMLITHCHEDHIGSLVFLAAAKYKLPKIYTSQFSKDFILTQMKNNNIPDEYIPEIQEVKEGEKIELGDNFVISPYNVSHSTAGALGFHILTKLNDQNNAGLLFTGDYHLDEVPIGEGFNAEKYKEFIQDKYVSHIFMDSTSATMKQNTNEEENPSRDIPDFDQAVANTIREISGHETKQIFSAVIARSVQNLAIDLKAARATGRTILIASKGLRDAFKVLMAGIRRGDREMLKKLNLDPDDKFDLNEVVYKAEDIDHADIQAYLNQYPASQRYIIISGAFAEDKAGRKSCLVTMSEQNKASVDEKGKVKGKGMSGHPIFTVDRNTLFMLRQRPIESINGDKHRALVSRLRALGATVILNGDNVETRYQRTGHATKEESELLHRLTLDNCQNHEEIRHNPHTVTDITIHGDMEQLQDLLNILSQDGSNSLLCQNSDVVMISPDGTQKIAGQPFEQQKWIGVQARSLSQNGRNDMFIFDLCDHNLMRESHLFTVMNVSSPKNINREDFVMNKAMEMAEKMESEGYSSSNIEIRRSYQSRGRRDRSRIESLSYEELKAQRQEKAKERFTKHKSRGKFSRRRGGRD